MQLELFLEMGSLNWLRYAFPWQIQSLILGSILCFGRVRLNFSSARHYSGGFFPGHFLAILMMRRPPQRKLVLLKNLPTIHLQHNLFNRKSTWEKWNMKLLSFISPLSSFYFHNNCSNRRTSTSDNFMHKKTFFNDVIIYYTVHYEVVDVCIIT